MPLATTAIATRRRESGHSDIGLDNKADRRLTVLGVPITDVKLARALEIVHGLIRDYDGRARTVFFVNAHTLNVAAADPAYRSVLNAADYVFGDGTGVRWAARLKGVRLSDNVNGTDLVPAMLRESGGQEYRYFLLGTDEESIGTAARHAVATFPGWVQAGYHHGYLQNAAVDAAAVRQINEARPHVLMVGMGNPLQESWIHRHREQLRVPVCMGVGGLFQYWAGTLRRAPRWLRHTGFEWLGILAQQPTKARRYLVGNPLFLARILVETLGRPT